MFAQAMLSHSLAAPAGCKAQPSLRRPAAAAASSGRPLAARRAGAAPRLAAPAPGVPRASRLPRLAAKKAPEPAPEEDEEDEEGEEFEEGEEGEETTDLWQVALTVEATAASVPKNVTHGDFCGLVQKTLQDCVPNLPTDQQMAEMEMFESSLMVITDQEDEVLFNCDEDAVYVEMTFFDVEAAETAVNEAIAGLEAKGWQAEIVDPDSMDDDEEYEEGEEEEE